VSKDNRQSSDAAKNILTSKRNRNIFEGQQNSVVLLGTNNAFTGQSFPIKPQNEIQSSRDKARRESFRNFEGLIQSISGQLKL